MTLDVTPDFLPWGSKPQGMSWNRWSRRQCCARKVRHDSWEDARVAGLLVWQENPQGVNPPTPYPCSIIGEPHYHCGHMKLPERRKPRRKLRARSSHRLHLTAAWGRQHRRSAPESSRGPLGLVPILPAGSNAGTYPVLCPHRFT